jgi:hypothetical protein
MQLQKIDPVSLQRVAELDKAPCLEIGEGEHVIKLYFQSEVNKKVFMEMDVKSCEGFR